jgi:hypothetical protein
MAVLPFKPVIKVEISLFQVVGIPTHRARFFVRAKGVIIYKDNV